MRLYFFLILVHININAFAQVSKQEQMFKDFISISNSYKQVPLQLYVEYRKANNLYKTDVDTNAIKGVFNIQKHGAYIHFGNVEQVINDSFTLAIMDDIKLMVLSVNNIKSGSILRTMITSTINDSSIEKLTTKYDIEKKIIDKNSALIKIASKVKLFKTDLQKEEIEIVYNIKNLQPQKLITISRSLVKKSKEFSEKISNQRIVDIPEKGEYIVKEEKVNLLFISIEHDIDKLLPVVMSDRITREETSSFAPVKKYEKYSLKFN